SQQLLFPLILSFSKSDMSILSEITDHLKSLGFVFETTGNEQIEIKGVPLLIPENEVGVVLDQLVSDYQQEVPEDSFSQSDVLAKALCKSLAVKTGDSLQQDSQIALLNDLFACKEPGRSPFNKPIYRTISETDIDKKFM
ncbi:MAG: DNA mismatch repair protein MutL, partial [Flavobacteriaceae bacterium]